MSIVALKNKTAAKYNNMSVGSNNFSLNGTHRSQGWVGQTMLSRSLPRTPMKGNVPKGHGGCCGNYDNKHIIQSAVTSLNDVNSVKLSSLSNMGMISTHYRWIKRPELSEKTFIKTKSNNIDSVKKAALKCKEDIIKDVDAGASKGNCGNLPNYKKPMICSVVTKKALKTTSYSTYIESIRSKCNIEIKNTVNSCKVMSLISGSLQNIESITIIDSYPTKVNMQILPKGITNIKSVVDKNTEKNYDYLYNKSTGILTIILLIANTNYNLIITPESSSIGIEKSFITPEYKSKILLDWGYIRDNKIKNLVNGDEYIMNILSLPNYVNTESINNNKVNVLYLIRSNINLNKYNKDFEYKRGLSINFWFKSNSNFISILSFAINPLTI